jgi:hypothetical protein
MKTVPKFEIGETVWIATCGQTEVIKPCPVCFGKLKVKLILGNDEVCELPCDYCGKGNFDRPTGVEKDYEWVSKPIQDTIKSISISGSGIEYHASNHYCGDNELIFKTKEEAEIKCAKLAAINAIENQKKLEFCRFNSKKSFTWNAGYHRGEAKRAARDLEYHTEKAVFMKMRAEEKNQQDNV